MSETEPKKKKKKQLVLLKLAKVASGPYVATGGGRHTLFFAMFMLRSTCPCLDPCVYVLYAMLVCLDLYVGCSAMCFYSPFVP